MISNFIVIDLNYFKNYKLNMSSEIRKYNKPTLDKESNLFTAEVLKFPNDKKLNISKDIEINIINFWKISDKSNEDQLKAVIGICFMFGILTLVGLYSNLL